MRDRGLIAAGLLLFLAVILSPVWYNLAARKSSRRPDLRLPAQEKACVAPVSYMKTSHMKLLLEWRDLAVRNNQRTYAAFDGKSYTISLTGTCLRRCHTDRTQFCDRCHAYSGVASPSCWDCHPDPRPAPAGQQAEGMLTGESHGR